MNSLKQNFNFRTVGRDRKSSARAGEFTTAHGKVLTPTFVPVGTQATIKSLTPQDLKDIGVQFFFGNTYHLHLRPGEDIVEEFGGLASFMGWKGSTITDSGGFQVFSLGKKKSIWGPAAPHPHQVLAQSSLRASQGSPSRVTPSHQSMGDKSSVNKIKILQEDEIETLVKITEDGVKFRSHLDGSEHFFTPEKSIQIQKKLGADIILSFDECPPFPSTHDEAASANKRTHAWAARGLEEFSLGGTRDRQMSNINPDSIGIKYQISNKNTPHPRPLPQERENTFQQGLVGIVQGSTYQDLREESAKFIGSMDFDALAIGGVSVGESKEDMRNAIQWVVPHLPEDKFRHLLGIGEVDDIFDAIELGMDTMDCVIPSRLARTGYVFVHPPEGKLENRFRIDLLKSQYLRSKDSIDPHCSCIVCKTYTRGYLHHLFKAKELLAYRLATYHNIFFLMDLTRKIREAILEERFQELKEEWYK